MVERRYGASDKIHGYQTGIEFFSDTLGARFGSSSSSQRRSDDTPYGAAGLTQGQQVGVVKFLEVAVGIEG